MLSHIEASRPKGTGFMRLRCPQCATPVQVPDHERDGTVRCASCSTVWTIDSTDGTSHAPTPHAGRVPADGQGFEGLSTDLRTLRRLYEEARERRQADKSAFLAAFVSARNALERDTWQTAAWDWRQAHLQLARVGRPRARPLVEQAHREFVEHASRQLLRFVRQMQQDWNHETAQLPPAARRKRFRKAAAALRAMTAGDNAGLVEPDVARQVQTLAEQLEAEAVANRSAAG